MSYRHPGEGACRRPAMLLLSAILTIASLVTTPFVPAATAVSGGSLALSPTSAIAGEDVTASGTLPTSADRPVRLERRSGTSWLLVDRATSTGASYQFLFEAPTATTIYRVHAPAAEVAGVPLEDLVTPARTETTLAQTATFTAPTSAVVGHDVTVTASFTPVRHDRGVRIQSFDGSSWVSVASGVEDATGKLVVDVPVGDSVGDLQLRARAAYWQGAAAVTSAPRTVHVTPVPPDTTPPGTVTGLTASEIGSDHVTLSWTNPDDGDLAGVMIRRRLGTTPPGRTGGDLVAQVGAPTTSYADYGVVPSTGYAYAVFAYDEVPNYSAAASTTATTLRYDIDPPGALTDLHVSAATTSSIDLAWTNPGDADYAGVEVRRLLGTTAPGDRTAGTLVIDAGPSAVSLHDTGLTAGRSYSYALFPHDDVANYGGAATVTAATDTAAVSTTAEWPQSRQGPEHRSWSPNETAIRASTLPSFGEEWSTTATGMPVIGGGQLFVPGHAGDGSSEVTSYDLADGSVQWVKGTGDCTGQPALTPTALVLACSTVRAYARNGTHALLWDTADTDPGQSFDHLLILGSTVVAWSNDRVVAYRMSDGQRLWQQLLPAGSSSVVDVAASGDKVVVVYGNRLRALSLTTGGQQWSVDITAYDVLVADGWVYTVGDGSVSRYDLGTGAPGWTVTPENGAYQLLAADNNTVYVWTAVFDFGPPSPSILRALRTSDGVQRWAVDVPSRIGTVAVTGSLVWLTSTDIFSQGRSSDLIALNRADGGQLRRVSFDDNMYGGQSGVAFGSGKVVFLQGGSAGGPPERLRIWGIAGARPDVTTRVLPMGRVGSPYTYQLTSGPAPGPITWSVATGALPAGITLAGSGLLSGTPTTAGQVQVTLRATSSNGRSHQRAMPLLVVPASSSTNWQTGGLSRSRNSFSPGTGALDITVAPGFGYRWQTAPVATPQQYFAPNVAIYGSRFYSTAGDGHLRAYSIAGSTANRAALWSADPGDPNVFTGQVGYDSTSGLLVVRSDDGRLWGVRGSDGFKQWFTAPGLASPYVPPLIVGDTVVSVGDDGLLDAVALADGSTRWAATLTTRAGWSELSTDGSRIYGVADCVLYALSATDGSELWHTSMLTSEADCADALYSQSAPIVTGGLVYASEPYSKLVARAATGAAVSRFRTINLFGGNGVVVGGLWIYPEDEDIVAEDITTGQQAWKVPLPPGYGHVNLSATGDLVIASNSSNIAGLDRLTGALVWDGGSFDGMTDNEESIAIGGSRILVPTTTGVRAYGPL